MKEATASSSCAGAAPCRAHLLRGARVSDGARGAVPPFVMETPIQGRLRFPDKSPADGVRPVRAKRVDDYTFEAQFADARFIHEF